jgi:hypothetical protein
VALPIDDGRVLRIRRATKPEPEHLQLYRQLGVPPEILRPIKTWSAAAPKQATAKPSD